jgi:hypothetical protein
MTRQKATVELPQFGRVWIRVEDESSVKVVLILFLRQAYGRSLIVIP